MKIPLWLSQRAAVATVTPADMRLKFATRAAFDLGDANRNIEAAELLQRAAQVAKGPASTELWALSDERFLRAGQIPTDIDAHVKALLDLADSTADQAAGNRLLGHAASLMFHRLRHLDGADSPLAQDPESFLQPLQGSSAWQKLTAARRAGRQSKLPPARMHVVVVVDDDTRFADPMIAAIKGLDESIDFRMVRLQQWARDRGFTLPLNPFEQIRARADSAISQRDWAAALESELNDADVVWVEWCQRAAVLVSLLNLTPRRVVVRLHSFEAFTVFPQLVDASSVDALITVSPTFEKFVKATAPELGKVTTYVPNAVDVSGIGRTKIASAGRTLGLVGWAAPAKDAMWALDVLEQLRKSDESWTMRLVGTAPDASGSAGEADYARRVNDRLNTLGSAVTRVGQVDDIADELTNIGVIVSSSTRESFHVALAEGVASGALPVVRDWPSLRRFGGARETWPKEWIVDTPEQAVQLIMTSAPPSTPADNLPEPRQAALLMLNVLRGTNAQ